jgi:hypothetical protein
VIYVPIVRDVLATDLSLYVACNTSANIGNIQACTDSFEPALIRARRGEDGQVEELRVLHLRQSCNKSNML